MHDPKNKIDKRSLILVMYQSLPSTPPYTNMFSVSRNSDNVLVLPLEFRKIFLFGLTSNFRPVSGVWGRHPLYRQLVR